MDPEQVKAELEAFLNFLIKKEDVVVVSVAEGKIPFPTVIHNLARSFVNGQGGNPRKEVEDGE